MRRKIRKLRQFLARRKKIKREKRRWKLLLYMPRPKLFKKIAKTPRLPITTGRRLSIVKENGTWKWIVRDREVFGEI